MIFLVYHKTILFSIKEMKVAFHSRIFAQNTHGDSFHVKIIKEAIAEANENENSDFKIYFMSN